VIRTPPAAANAGACYVRVIGPPMGAYDLRIGGRGLELTPRGFLVPRRDLEGESFEIAIQSDRQAIDDTGRIAGVRVRDVTIACAR
jgi:hypothetical protein